MGAEYIQSLFLALDLHPEVQKKAWAELDNFSFTDRDALPYVNAVAKELSRWHMLGCWASRTAAPKMMSTMGISSPPIRLS